jgi:hypothetical protein
MIKTTLGTASLSVALAVLTGAAAASEAPAVDAEINATHWNTVFEQTVPLAWDWSWQWVPTNAVQAELTLSGLSSTIRQTFQKPASNYLWTVHAGPASFKEDSFGVTLSFLDGAGVPLAHRTTRLNVLAGAFFGADAKAVSTNASAWKTAATRVLLPYDRAWSAETAGATSARLSWTTGGATVFSTNLSDSAAGVYPWCSAGWPRGDYRVDLAFDGAATPAWTAFLQMSPAGTAVVLR